MVLYNKSKAKFKCMQNNQFCKLIWYYKLWYFGAWWSGCYGNLPNVCEIVFKEVFTELQRMEGDHWREKNYQQIPEGY
jgi:hypothetical protein